MLCDDKSLEHYETIKKNNTSSTPNDDSVKP